MKRLAALLLLLAGCAQVLSGADPFFKSTDVVALVGGEEMAIMRDHPGLEMLVIQQPGLSGVKFRNLAQEGDTVFEQFRDLNFPSWEEQMKKVGATVVIAQFGKMESFAGKDGVAAFIAAYEKLLDHLAGDGRRVVLMSPMPFGPPMSGAGSDARDEAKARNAELRLYVRAAQELATRRNCRFLNLTREKEGLLLPAATSDGLHLARCYPYGWIPARFADGLGLNNEVTHGPDSPLQPLLKEKNTLWFHYWRPQNWAFLAGDRTQQPSSRDHRDPSKRWFPAEMEKWLPLIAAKEKQIQAMIEASRKP